MRKDDGHVTEDLPDYLEGSISGHQTKIIEDHLKTCEQCQSSLREWTQMKEAIGILEHIEPPPWLVSKIMHQIREQESLNRSLLRRFFYPFHIKIPVHAIATCIIAVMVIFLHNHLGPGTFPGQETNESVTAPENLNGTGAPAIKSGDTTGGTASTALRNRASGSNKPASGTQQDSPSVIQKESADESRTQEVQRIEQQNIQPPSIENLKKETVPAAAIPKPKSIPESLRSSAADNQSPQSLKPEMVVFTILTNSFSGTAEQVKDLLVRLDARNVESSVNDPIKSSVAGELPSENLQTFSKALEQIAQVQSRKGTHTESRGYTTVRIEIRKSNSNR